MPSLVKDIKFVDLKRSTWNEKKSNRKNGEYDISNKVYYRNRDFKEGYVHPYKLKWCKFSENDYPRPFITWETWKIQYKAMFLTAKDDYWPEGMSPDTEGKYVFGDLVAVKIPIEIHMEHKRRAVEKSEREARAVKKAFETEMDQAGVRVSPKTIEDKMDRVREDARDIGV